ncbi:hypothetical protein F3087_44990 [Nocardia colli]|uniref:Uncharacterized protein n=1 Tax=Nocardia colli TaxID=2545717 RepID=A0A5N0DJU4_9NOCA|nr:hypothetical protein [Nocardia colli]KAA8877332.1 hypothetical protein F3087_44990 [Nocardia colli]
MAIYAVTTMMAGVFGGGTISAALAGHGIGLLTPEQMIPTLGRLMRRPGDLAAAWPGDPRPGPAWLSWICIVVVAVLWCACATLASDEIDSRRRHRRRPGLATAADLRSAGLNRRSALRRAAHEFPSLLRPSGPRRWRR